MSLNTSQLMPKIMRHLKIVCLGQKRTYWLLFHIASMKKLKSWILDVRKRLTIRDWQKTMQYCGLIFQIHTSELRPLNWRDTSVAGIELSLTTDIEA